MIEICVIAEIYQILILTYLDINNFSHWLHHPYLSSFKIIFFVPSLILVKILYYYYILKQILNFLSIIFNNILF